MKKKNTFMMYCSDVSVNVRPEMTKSMEGMSFTLSQSTIAAPPTGNGVAPMALLIFATSALGPAIREVPVSAIA